MSTYNNLGTVDMWRARKSALDSGRPASAKPTIVDPEQSKLKKLNNMHGRFMDKVTSKLSEAEEIMTEANKDYNSLTSAIENAIRLVEQSEQNGNVVSDAGPNSYNASTINTSALQSSLLGEKPERDTAMMVTGNSSSLSTSVTDTPSAIAAASVGAVAGGNIASSVTESVATSQAASVNNIVGVDITTGQDFSSITSTNAMGSQPIGSGTWGRLSNVEQVNVVGKLQEVGFSQEEIKAIVAGDASVASVEVAALSTSLEVTLVTHPELRTEIVNMYGFDVFNEEGSIDPEKLSLIVLIDDKNDDDIYSLIEFLHAKYGISLIPEEEYEHICHLIEELEEYFEEIQVFIKNRYGFDIFNDDRSVNRSKLTLALLMDKEKEGDSFSLLDYLLNLRKEKNGVKITNSGGVKTLSGVSLLGVTPGGMAILAGKKKGNEEIENDTQVVEVLEQNEKVELLDNVGKEQK